MDYILLAYAIIFGVIGVYLVTLWQRGRNVWKDEG